MVDPSPFIQDSKLNFEYIGYDEFGSLPLPDWLVEGVLVANDSNLIFGASNAFKTMLAIDLGCSVGTGRSWHGRRVKQGRVLYIATEGRNGVCSLRIRGWMDRHDIPLERRRNIEVLKSEIYISDPGDVVKLIQDLRIKGKDGGYLLIVLDVAAGTMAGSESDDEVAKAWVQGSQRLMTEFELTVLAITHTGWADATRARGHTHLWGSFNGRLKVTGDPAARTTILSVNRFKDADSTGRWGFRFEPHHFSDDRGHDLSTLIPVLDATVKDGDAAGSMPARPRGRNQRKVLEALDQALKTAGQAAPGCTGMPTHGQVTTFEAWETCAKAALESVDSRHRRQTFAVAADALMDQGFVGRHNGYVWQVTR